jgi:uncharacterized membrane protein YphA (DoxX/SURF4 family)
MNPTDVKTQSTPRPAGIWAGRILTGFVAFVFGMSGFMKLKGGPQLEEGMAHLGLPESMVFPLAILEITCVVVYLIPATSILGAILLTGYIGGAICTHWRLGDPFVIQVIIGILIWLGLFCREPRLRALIPFKTIRPPKP